MDDANAKCLALSFALTALIKTLENSGVLSMDAMFKNLAGATARLKQMGEHDAAGLLGSFALSLQRI